MSQTACRIEPVEKNWRGFISGREEKLIPYNKDNCRQ